MVAMALEANVSIEKIRKHASGASGDTAEIVERADGGFSIVLVDGQGSGQGAKALSLLISARAVSLLKDGVRDRAAVEGVHDFLLAHRGGRVSATIDIVTLTPVEQSILITRQSSVPLALDTGSGFQGIVCESGPIGRRTTGQPWCHEGSMAPNLRVIVTTDGVPGAGSHGGNPGFDVATFANESLAAEPDADVIASAILDEAVRRDRNRPRDDLTVVAVTVAAATRQSARRMMALRVPL